MADYSWGRFPKQPQELLPLRSRHEILTLPAGRSALPYGLGRSYGDSCLNDGGVLLATRALDRFIAWDAERGVLECEAGVSLQEIIRLVLPQSWFLPVTPGTQFVTVGGAIANDVHGKNHHVAGSFGHHLLGFELLRSDSSLRDCTPQQNPEWFSATIGGLGLTGLIRRVRLQLRRVPGPWLSGESQRFDTLDEFLDLSRAAEKTHEYSLAWMDCLAPQGRGIFQRAMHIEGAQAEPRAMPLSMPFTPPFSLVNRLSCAWFNRANFHRHPASVQPHYWHWQKFFYPLDRIAHWNRMYGPAGFLQYQCVVPPGDALFSLREMLKEIAHSGQGSFLAVLKMFGEKSGLGLLSFPRPGVTLALDFPYHGAETLALLERLDRITQAAGGAVYPAKDARMSGAAFRQYFPRWVAMNDFVDPRFSSSFWRRVQA